MSRFLTIMILLAGAGPASAADVPKEVAPARHPHMVTLAFTIANVDGDPDVAAIKSRLGKVASVDQAATLVQPGSVVVRFDSHVVSYHQVAQAILEANPHADRPFNPGLMITVPDYAKDGNAEKVDVLFKGKRLNQRVHVEPVDKAKGQFVIHFLPLVLEAGATGPQGFNGGHLNHPLHDPPPRGLGLTCAYASEIAPAQEKK